VLEWVTVFGRVNHLGAEPGTQAYLAWACPLRLGWNEYPAKAGGVNSHIVWYTSAYPWSRSVRWCLAENKLAEIGADVREAVVHCSIRGATRRCAVQIHVHFTLLQQDKTCNSKQRKDCKVEIEAEKKLPQTMPRSESALSGLTTSLESVAVLCFHGLLVTHYQ